MIKRTTKGVLNPTFVSILILVIVSLCLQFVQIQNKNLYLGYDWIFHYNRFYDAAQQIKEGNFQYFISMYGFSQSGRIINAVYGPMFAYFNGLLLLICGSWFKYQLFTNFLITFFSAVSMFFLLKKNEVRSLVSILLAIVYTTFNIVQGWLFNQTFNTWGAVILPIGILVATNFLKKDVSWKLTFLLAFVVTLSIQIHILTSLFLIVILGVFFLIGVWISSNKLNLMKSVIIAAIITIAMTANVWYPLIELNFENVMNPPFLSYDFDSSALQVSLFKLPAHITIIVFLLFILQFLFVLYLRVNLINRLATIFGLLFFLMATKVFPWNEILEKVPGISILQFPSRFLVVAIVFIVLGLGLSIEQLIYHKKKIYTNVMYILLIMIVTGGVTQHIIATENRLSTWNSETVISMDRTTILMEKDSSVLKNSFSPKASLDAPLKLFVKPTPDYVPLKNKKLITDANFHPYQEYRQTILDNNLNSRIEKSVENKKLILKWQSDNIEQQTLPIFVYHRTQLYLNGKLLDKKNIVTNNIGALIIDSKKGSNVLIVSYKSSPLFSYLFIVSVVSWIVFIGLSIRLFYRRTDYL